MKKTLALFMATALIGLSMTACGNSDNASSASQSGSSSQSLSGSITAAGSSALQPLVQAAADDLKAKNPDLSITVNAGGSGQGLQNALNKTVDIGNSDVFAEEKLDASSSKTLVDHQVCVVGVAAVVNPDVKVTSITKDQLIKIFTGKIKNWKEVGGNDEAIVIINRPSSSGTRALFKKYGLDGNDEVTGQALTEDNSGTLRQNVTQTKGSISYLAFSYLDSSVNALSIDGVKPAYDNVYSGKYPIWGYEHMYTNGEASGAAKALIDYMKSDSFSSTVTAKGYGLIGKMTVKRAAPAAK
ncbi:MAG TPA: phosphate ABC transporter substrate-binding protein [Clostridia bacterium]|nr:phosphate ABC transporter substrate-binding protein [Clostridia bacterium]